MVGIVGTISFTTITEKKGAGATTASVQAFQIADSGLQGALKALKNGITDPAIANGYISEAFAAFPACSAGEIVEDPSPVLTGAAYTISFWSGDVEDPDKQIKDCNALINTIRNIKVVGTYKETVRAVSVAVSPWLQGSCQSEFDSAKLLFVYNTDLAADEAWAKNGEQNNLCDTTNECEDGTNPPAGINLKETSSDIFADYPAQDDCKGDIDGDGIDDGGRLPTEKELDCVHKSVTIDSGPDKDANFGAYGNFSFDASGIYYTSAQADLPNDPNKEAKSINFSLPWASGNVSSSTISQLKNDSAHVRCVRTATP